MQGNKNPLLPQKEFIGKNVDGWSRAGIPLCAQMVFYLLTCQTYQGLALFFAEHAPLLL